MTIPWETYIISYYFRGDIMACIYCILNTISNLSYIGQTKQPLQERLRKHFSLLRNNSHFNIHLQNAFNLYGEEAFTAFILCECKEEELNRLEILYIKLFDTYKNGYNRTEGGAGVISKEAQLKNKISNQSKWDNILKINIDALKIEKVYMSMHEAAKEENVSVSSIYKSCKDKGRIVKGFYYIKESDFTSNWKPHLKTNNMPLCLINNNNCILFFFLSKKDAMRKLNLSKTQAVDMKIEQHIEISYKEFKGYLIQISQEECYKYNIGTRIDYPR